MSTQEIASSSLGAESAERCWRCGAALAGDQAYCLECGERRAPARSALLGGPPGASAPGATPASPPGYPPPQSPARSNGVVLLAGVGVLLLAMGVGVLIGRSVAPSSSAGPAEVITVGSPGTGSSGAPGAATGGEFSDDWPSGKSGYTVLLQSLPQASTTASAVTQAKSAASAKGAPAVGALKTGDFSSLSPGSYDVYSGEFTTKGQAEKALAKLKGAFPGASVIKVSSSGAGSAGGGGNGGSSSSSGSGGSGGGSSGSGSSSQLQKLSKTRGKNYEQESKNLPNEVGT